MVYFFLNKEVGLVIQNWEHLILFIESVHHRVQLVIRTWERKLSVRKTKDGYVICYWRWLQIYLQRWMENGPDTKITKFSKIIKYKKNVDRERGALSTYGSLIEKILVSKFKIIYNFESMFNLAYVDHLT